MKELMVPKAKNMFQVNNEKQETEVSRTTRQNFLRRYLKAIKVFSLKVPSPLFDTVLNRPLEKYVRDHLPIDDFRGNRTSLIHFNSFSIRTIMWRSEKLVEM